MNKPVLFLLCCTNAFLLHGQGCDTAFVGVPRAISTGPNDTPFPTTYRSSKVQYLFTAQELAEAQCVFAPIHGILLQMAGNDSCSLGPGCPALDVQVRMGNTAAVNMDAFDGLVSSSPALVTTTLAQGIAQGTLALHFSNPFMWDGAGNVIVELCYLRSTYAGIAPAAVLDTGFAHATTRYAHHIAPFGCSLTETTSGVLTGSGNSRPVMGFLTPDAIVGSPPMVPSQEVLFPNPARDHVQLPVGADIVRIELLDASGRTLGVSVGPFDMRDGGIRIPLASISPGLVFVHALAGDGAFTVHRLVVAR